MAEVRKINGVYLVATGKHSGKDLTNIVGRTATDVIFTQFNLTVGDPAYGDGSLTVQNRTRTNAGADYGWGDGTVTADLGNGEINIPHTYASAGTYTFRCRGTYKIFGSQTDTWQRKITQLKRLDSWKNEQDPGAWLNTSLGAENIVRFNLETFTNWGNSFNASTIVSGISGLTFSYDIPVTLGSAFRNCTNWNDDISSWDVKITPRGSLSFCFSNTQFNSSLSDWDVKGCQTFQGIFSGSGPFNQDLGDWEPTGTLYEGTNDAVATNRLIDSTQSFGNFGNNQVLNPGDFVVNDTTERTARIISKVSATELELETDIFPVVGAPYSIHIDRQAVDNNPDSRGVTFQWDGCFNNAFQNAEVLGPGTGWDRWDARYIASFRTAFRFKSFGGGTEYTGTNTSVATNQLIDSGATFDTDEVTTSWTVFNLATNDTALVTSVVDGQTLQLSADIFPSSSTNYAIHRVLYLDSWKPELMASMSTAWFGNNQNLSVGGWDFNGKRQAGANTTVTAFKLIDSSATFETNNVMYRHYVRNITDNTLTRVASVDSETQLTLDDDIFTGTGKRYFVYSVQRSMGLMCNTPRMNCGLYPGVAHSRTNGWDTLGFTGIGDIFGSGWNGDCTNWNVHECLSMKIPRGNYDYSNWERSTVGDESTVANCRNFNNLMRQLPFNAGLAQNAVGTRLGNWQINTSPSVNVAMQAMCFFNGWFNQDISTWNMSRVTNVRDMFYGSSWNSGVAQGVAHTNTANWITSATTNMYQMFRDSTGFNGEVDSWDVSGADSLGLCFFGMKSQANFNQYFGSWQFKTGANAASLAYATTTITDANVANILVGWDAVVGQGEAVNMTNWCSSNAGPRTLAIATYSSAKTAYDNLIASVGSGGKGWDMTGAITWV